jgi:hypothetical protein
MIAHDPFRHQFTCIYVSWLGNERAHLHIACVFACASEGTLQNVLVQVHVCVCVGYGPTQNTCEHSILWRCSCCCKQIADTYIQSALLYSSVRCNSILACLLLKSIHKVSGSCLKLLIFITLYSHLMCDAHNSTHISTYFPATSVPLGQPYCH